MYCSSELARSYYHPTCQILHAKYYSHAEHTKSNSCVELDSDSSAAQEVKLGVTSGLRQITRIKLNNTHMKGTHECKLSCELYHIYNIIIITATVYMVKFCY